MCFGTAVEKITILDNANGKIIQIYPMTNGNIQKDNVSDVIYSDDFTFNLQSGRICLSIFLRSSALYKWISST